MQPQIVIENWEGRHNAGKSLERVVSQGLYQDCSTVCIVPTRGTIAAKVVQNWMGLLTPMNQKFMRVFAIGLEVGAAYSSTIDQILAHPELSSWKYVLTLEEDNLPPPDGLIKLMEAMHKHPEYSAIGGLYWTKGDSGQPMCYGRADQHPRNMIPFAPQPNEITECNGLGMGFTLFKMEMFKDGKITKPLFETLQRYDPGKGVSCFTQDLAFFEKARAVGYRFACHAGVLVGHYDLSSDIVW
jgi:hypothetical protein